MKLVFPELGGGPFQGLNDAGVENFQGAIDTYVARECGQNTIDAPEDAGKGVRLEFHRMELRADDIPSFGELREALQHCLEASRGKPKELKYFQQALEHASAPKIPVLKLSDLGTTGLSGADMDEAGRWFALVKSQGLSVKGDTSAGSFGIGKSSPFAASAFRTVFYGTKTLAGDVALQGVCRLMSHRPNGGRARQATGFIGDYDEHGGPGREPLFKAVRSDDRIPPLFRRDRAGTDIWIIGYRSGAEWKAELTKSILTNFWPAIHYGTITFSVDGQDITQANCESLINGFAGAEEFDAHQYYRAVRTQPVEKTLRHTGSCKLYLTVDSPDLPKRVCMVRSSGMRIFDHKPTACRVPFSGLFICTSQDGNKLLKAMEPPRHDTWDPKRIEGPEGRLALSEIKDWIREEVKKLNPLFAGNSFNEEELAKYLPEQADEDRSEALDPSIGEPDDVSLTPVPRTEPTSIKPIAPRPVAVTPEEGDGEGGGAGDVGIGPSGDGEGADGESKGPRGGSRAGGAVATGVQVRCFCVDGHGTYELAVRPTADFAGSITMSAIGEDGTREPVVIQRVARKSAGGVEPVVNGSVISGISARAGEATRYVLELDALSRVALTGVARS